jgi:hypothetical protein
MYTYFILTFSTISRFVTYIDIENWFRTPINKYFLFYFPTTYVQ